MLESMVSEDLCESGTTTNRLWRACLVQKTTKDIKENNATGTRRAKEMRRAKIEIKIKNDEK